MNEKSMAGWIGFAGMLLLIIGFIDIFQGLIALFEDVVVSLNVFAQLGFLGNSQYPLWALTALTLNIVVLYALTVRWDESKFGLEPGRPMG